MSEDATQAAAGLLQDDVVTRDTEVTINAFFKHSRVKQYLKGRAGATDRDGRQLPKRPGCPRCLHHLDQLQVKARDVNRRLLDTERVGQGCVLASPAFERIAPRSPRAGGPALRFGDLGRACSAPYAPASTPSGSPAGACAPG